MKLCHFHLFIFLFFSFIFSPSSSQASLPHQCLDNQKLALLRFKNESFSFSSSSSSKSESWKPDTDCCSWEGIKCDNTTGHVICLDLSWDQLVGDIDSNSSLFKLHSLMRLNLSHNSFHFFNFNSELFGFPQLVNLTHLDLANSGFSGQVPLQMSRLTKLVSLNLSDNQQLKLENPNLKMLVQNMSSLRELCLDKVNMSTRNGNWCKAISSAAPNLLVLRLWDCSLSGPIDSSISNLHLLSELVLSNNNLLSEVPDVLTNLSSLVSIQLSSCGLHGEFPGGIFQLPNLQIIDVSNNPNLYGLLPEFPQQSALRELSLSCTKFHGKLPESIGNLEFLTNLYLDNCNFSGTLPNSIGNLTALQYLSLSSNYFSGSIPSLALPKKITDELVEQSHLSPESRLLNLRLLDLRNNSFDGITDYSLFTLPSLKDLMLGKNRFHSLPDEGPFTPSSSLSWLDLSENEFQGPISRLLTVLTSLEILNLSSNKFNGSMDLGMFSNLTKLRHLYLSHNDWSITASANLTFPQLVSLHLSHNHWSMTDSDDLAFPNLKMLKMRSCNVTKFPSFLRNLHSMEALDLSSNGINGQIPNWIWSSSLIGLNLSQNLLTGLDRPLPDASSLQMRALDVHSNKLQGSLPFLSQQIEFLDYSDNNFRSVIPADIGSYLSKAFFFSVSGNNLIGKIPTSICSARKLQVLDLSDNQLNGTIPTCLGNFSSELLVLNLGGNNLQGTMPWSYAETLSTLVFNGNGLEGKVPRSLSTCKGLEVLDLGDNQIHDTFPFWLGNLPQLQVLVLCSNKFYGPIGYPQNKNVFPMLHVIDIASNDFVGHLPSEYFLTWTAMMKVDEGKSKVQYLGVSASYSYYITVKLKMKGENMTLERILNIFTSINLSNNEFEGKIPKLIGELKSLHVLDLSHNNLDGPIPSSLENLLQLESLDLSHNKLSGEIPQQLVRLTFLSYINLSENELQGSIPSGAQFNTFPAGSYEGNPGLCGFPLPTKCEAAKEALPPIQQQKLELDSTGEFDWTVLLMGYGCGLVAGLSTGYILFWGNGFIAESITTKMQQSRLRSSQRRRS